MALPWSAARRYHCTAVRSSRVTPLPFAYIQPRLRCASALPRSAARCTPPGASWLDLVESWFSGVTQQRRRGAFCSVRELVAAIEDHWTHHDADTGPFVWSTTVDAVLDRVRGGGATPGTGR